MYDYRDERGTLLHPVVRFDPRTFDRAGPAVRRLDVGRQGRATCRVPATRTRSTARVSHEGEKDADALAALGLPATTTPSGAESWRDVYAQQIQAAGVPEIVAIPDNDEPGRAYVQRAAAALTRHGVRVRVLELPGLPPKGDVSDWRLGHTATSSPCSPTPPRSSRRRPP